MPQYLSTRHEEVAVGMASGYAKATGKLPAVMIHTTVGSLHATMGMRGAIREQVPMVVFSGESIGYGEDEGPDPGGQWLGHLSNIGGPAKMVEQTVKWSFGVTTKRFCRRRFNAPASSRWRRRRADVRVFVDGTSIRQDDQRRSLGWLRAWSDRRSKGHRGACEAAGRRKTRSLSPKIRGARKVCALPG